jgi:hypothetical protein
MKSSPGTVVLATSGHERLSAANGPDRFTATNELREGPVRHGHRGRHQLADQEGRQARTGARLLSRKGCPFREGDDAGGPLTSPVSFPSRNLPSGRRPEAIDRRPLPKTKHLVVDPRGGGSEGV